MKGEGNQIAFEARIYDPRLGRFLSCDPLEDEYPYQSTYVFAHNNPVALIDYLGMGDPPSLNWEYFSKRHVLSGDFSVNTPSGGTNSVITNPAWQNESTVKSFFNEALELAKKTGKTETNVTLKNGTQWSINTKTGHFNPISGEGITNLTNQEIAVLRSAKKGGAAGETIFANIAKYKSLTGTFSEGMQTALNSLAKIEGVTDATALKHIGGHLPTSAATTELATAANKSFGSGAWKYAKWGGRALIVVGVASDLYEIYNSDNKARTITTIAGGWGGATAGASGGTAVG
ncbi:MAG TPA: RHS repeat-associated core domain-containing protein, partial [Cytophagaceae bacterium]